MNWQTVIGLEVHAQLSTQSKLFSTSPTQYGALPNTQVNEVDAGLPGVLPVLNQKAVQMAIQFGLAIHAELNHHSYFERKNYFYPDLPKGYQISQFQRPIVGEGYLDIPLSNGQTKRVIIQRAHLEEDAGKSMHDKHSLYTGIDLNRAGTPLLEIVTTPCLHSAEEAVAYLKTLHQLLRFLGICDGNMQEGSFRCDVNLSLRPQGQSQLGTRTELKNLNSFRFIEKAIQYEECRHQDQLESGQVIHQETRLYNPDKHQTEVLRSKENENDYRYFPDPDLLPIHISASEIEALQQSMPPLPQALSQRFQANDQLSEMQVEFLLTSPALVRFYQQVQQCTMAPAKTIVNWLKGHYSAALNENGLTFDNPPVSAKLFAQLLDHIHNNTLSNNAAKKIFIELLSGHQDIDEIIQREGLHVTSDTAALEETISNIIQQYPEQVAEYQSGKDKLLSFFIGQVMKATRGQAEPSLVSPLLLKYLMKKTL